MIDNASTPKVTSEVIDFVRNDNDAQLTIIRNEEQPPHLYHMWNIGFDACEKMAHDANVLLWNVSVFNDDVVLPDDWFTAVGHALRSHHSAVIACGSTSNYVGRPIFKTTPDGNFMTRMTPWAFMMRGESRLRADERFHWWYGDNDFEWQACQSGGVLVIPGYVTANTLANSTTVGVLAEQAGRDGEAFVAKWGRSPW